MSVPEKSGFFLVQGKKATELQWPFRRRARGFSDGYDVHFARPQVPCVTDFRVHLFQQVNAYATLCVDHRPNMCTEVARS